jgi:tRNA modification GTPase
MDIEDTIVAVSSPPGSAARGIVRLSGPESIAIAQGMFTADDGAVLVGRPGAAHVSGAVRVGGGALPAAVYLFRGPRSYTRQDVIELHTLGSPPVLGMLVEACLAAGARRAEPGEFTARAFLAGGLDLSQVHGIAGMIAAQTDDQLRAAERLLHGALSAAAERAREELADLLSLVEGAMDFADEPISFITVADLRRRLVAVLASLESTAAAGARAERWLRLPRVLLAGAPNVGKSSLLNRLTGMDRAICAPLAGTTRDVVTAPLSLDETDCLLVDAAGLVAQASSEPDAKAQAAALAAIREADLTIHVLDASVGNAALRVAPSDGDAPMILAWNKSDLLPEGARPAASARCDVEHDGGCLVSAATGEGIARLKEMIASRLHGRRADADDAAIALMAEHREALSEAVEALLAAITAADDCDEELTGADLVAAELHLAADALGLLVGKDQTEDMLGRIFARFCVGK